MKKNQQGFGIIEVVLALAIASLIIVSIGKVLNSVHRLYTASEYKTRALNYAQNSLEIITDIKNDFFACRCSADDCISTPGSCRLNVDSQACQLSTGYTSCWVSYPASHLNQTDFHLQRTGSMWQLINGPENPIAADPEFSRVINITNVFRDSNGDIADTGIADPGTKKITVTVSWVERGENKSVSVSTVLTAWQNL